MRKTVYTNRGKFIYPIRELMDYSYNEEYLVRDDFEERGVRRVAYREQEER